MTTMATLKFYDSDITRRKHGCNPASSDAEQIAKLTRLEKLERIIVMADAAGPKGITLYEVETETHWLIQTISPLLTRLKASGELVDSGHRRKSPTGATCTVLVRPQFADDVEVSQ